MQQRHPPTVLAPCHAERSSIRRRSGRGPNKSEPPEPKQPPGLRIEVENTDVANIHDQPTILLVQQSRPSPVLPCLPAFAPGSTTISTQIRYPLVAESEQSKLLKSIEQPQELISFSAIPLTPRPDLRARVASEVSVESTQTRASRISRLPTPDFTDHKRRGSISLHSLVPRRALDLVSFRKSPACSSTSLTLNHRPRSTRSTSNDSARSSWSYRSSSSVDSGHVHLIPTVGTTDKFTHKWPKPQSVKNLEVREGGLNASGAALSKVAIQELEDGQGLGMDRVERWTSFKWSLLISVTTVFMYGAAGLAGALITWFRTWSYADVMYVADSDILILITLASSILLFTSLLGTTGTLLNSRPILALYALLLWPALLSMLAVGYISYKRATFALDHKLNLSWSQYYTPLGRLLIQDSLRCCGYYNALHEATPSSRCYSRTSLPGCKGGLYRFERENLETIWSVVFAIVPLHLVNMVTALLCANHITRTFGKGIMPKKYRLSSTDVKADAEKILKGVVSNGVIPVTRPDMTRASSNGVLREDREERMW